MIVSIFFLSALLVLSALVLGAWWLASGGGRRPAQDILDERLARGELSVEEHRERADALGPRRNPGLGRVAVVLAVLGLAGLVGSTAAAGAMGWGRMMDGGMMGHMMDGGMMGGGMMGGSTGRSAPAPEQDATEETVVADEFLFRPDSLRVTAGEPVNIELDNQGGAFHTFTVTELDFELRAAPGEEVAGSLRVDEAGAYRFFCAVPGHEEAGMTGTLVVEA